MYGDGGGSGSGGVGDVFNVVVATTYNKLSNSNLLCELGSRSTFFYPSGEQLPHIHIKISHLSPQQCSLAPSRALCKRPPFSYGTFCILRTSGESDEKYSICLLLLLCSCCAS